MNGFTLTQLTVPLGTKGTGRQGAHFTMQCVAVNTDLVYMSSVQYLIQL